MAVQPCHFPKTAKETGPQRFYLQEKVELFSALVFIIFITLCLIITNNLNLVYA